MTKKKKPRASTATAKPAATPIPPVDVLDLPEAIEQEIDKLGGYQSGYSKQQDVVEKLEAELKTAREQLEHLAQPLRAVHDLLNSDKVRQMQASRPHDAEFKLIVGHVTLKKAKWEGGKPTGAKPWKELQRDGASDAQILKNLRAVQYDRRGRDASYALRNTTGRNEVIEFVRIPSGPHSWNDCKPVVKGETSLIAECRRIFGVADKTPPASAKPVAQKSPAPKKRTKRPKSSGKSRPAAAAQKTAPAAKSSKKPVTRETIRQAAETAKANVGTKATIAPSEQSPAEREATAAKLLKAVYHPPKPVEPTTKRGRGRPKGSTKAAMDARLASEPIIQTIHAEGVANGTHRPLATDEKIAAARASDSKTATNGRANRVAGFATPPGRNLRASRNGQNHDRELARLNER